MIERRVDGVSDAAADWHATRTSHACYSKVEIYAPEINGTMNASSLKRRLWGWRVANA
jgi:hypothetical protein